MIARFGLDRGPRPLKITLKSRPSLPELPDTGDTPQAYRRGLLLIAGLTLWLVGWLLYRWIAHPAWLRQLPAVVGEMVVLAETAGAVTLAFLWAGLTWRTWRDLRRARARAVPEVSLDALQSLSPRAFERYVAGLFRLKGYRVVVRGRSGDLGVDLEITAKGGRRAIVQCKRYQNTVGAEIVRELFGTMVHERVAWAFLVTTADISPAARRWAVGKPLTLIDGETLLQIAAALRG